MGDNKDIELVLKRMIGSKVVGTGSLDYIWECGLYIDYEKEGEVHRFVMGCNELGSWIEYDGKLSDFAPEKCVTAKL